MLKRIVLTWLSTARGGAEKSVPELAAHLAALGVACELVWWRHGGPPCAPVPRVTVTEVGDARAYRDRLWAAIQHPGTVVISNHRTSTLDVATARRSPVLPVLRAIMCAGTPLRAVDPENGLLTEYTPALLPWPLLGAAAAWVGISAAATRSLRPFLPPGTRTATIPNGVPIPALVLARTRRPGPFRAVAVARAAPWKRLDVLLDAVAHPDLRGLVSLDVYGEVGDVRVPRGAPVRLCGWTEDLPGVLGGYDVLVSAALLEGFGRCVVDAAGAGVPALVPHAGAGPEVVLDGFTGRLYDPHDDTGLIKALMWATRADPLELAAMGAAARAHALAWFTPARVAAQYLQLAHRSLSAVQA